MYSYINILTIQTEACKGLLGRGSKTVARGPDFRPFPQIFYQPRPWCKATIIRMNPHTRLWMCFN